MELIPSASVSRACALFQPMPTLDQKGDISRLKSGSLPRGNRGLDDLPYGVDGKRFKTHFQGD